MSKLHGYDGEILLKSGILDPDGNYPNPFTGAQPTEYYKKQAGNSDMSKGKGWRHYSTWKDHDIILEKIAKYQIMLLTSPTGSGKTVIIPKLLSHYFNYERPIIITTPRILTTEEAAVYSAKLLDVPIFKTDENGIDIKNEKHSGNDPRIQTGDLFVGFKHGNRSLYSPKQTKLLYSTDGSIKTTILQVDPDLSRYSGIIIDEAHERSVNIDILIALVMDIVKRRPDFRVIIMSATVNEAIFINYFKRIGFADKFTQYTPIVAETQYPIKFIKQSKIFRKDDIVGNAVAKIDHILKNDVDNNGFQGDILCFVTSDAETLNIKRQIDYKWAEYPEEGKPYTIALSRRVSHADKEIAIKRGGLAIAGPQYKRRVIISTNVAESSITFEDPLTIVVDVGMAYEKLYNPVDYCYNSGRNYVSQASVLQRCGRTGRRNAGMCIQLYTDAMWNTFKKYTNPKILDEDFTPHLLGILCLSNIGGIVKAIEFISNMIEPVENYKNSVRRAVQNLSELGLVSPMGNITPLGRICNNFGKYDMHIARMIICGMYFGVVDDALALGAILTEIESFEDMFVRPPRMDKDPEIEAKYYSNMLYFKHTSGDHLTLLNIFNKWRETPSSQRGKFCATYNLSSQKLHKILYTLSEIKEIVDHERKFIAKLKLFNHQLEFPEELPNQDKAIIKSVANIVATDDIPINTPDNIDVADLSGGGKRDKMARALADKKESRIIKARELLLDDLSLKKIDNMFKGVETVENKSAVNINLSELSHDNKLLCALYYGFHTNMASHSGLGGKKYNVKFSSEKGSISKSILDKLNITPEYIIYKEFNVSTDAMMESSRLSIVSGINDDIIRVFHPMWESIKREKYILTGVNNKSLRVPSIKHNSVKNKRGNRNKNNMNKKQTPKQTPKQVSIKKGKIKTIKKKLMKAPKKFK